MCYIALYSCGHYKGHGNVQRQQRGREFDILLMVLMQSLQFQVTS